MLACPASGGSTPTMEITCNRCKTEYDFDDALVSERGTTVRCTNCGEQFKIYRAHTSEVPEQWIVQRKDGRELVFTNLRDLQKAITNLQVGRHDTLSRGNAPPRPLGAIAELEPFFVSRLAPNAKPQELQSPPSSDDAVDTLPRGGPREELPARTGRTGHPPIEGPPMPPAVTFGAPPPIAPRMMASDPDIERTMRDPRARPRMSPGTAPYAPVDLNAAPRSPLPTAASNPSIVPSYEPPSGDSYDSEQDWFGEPRFSNSPGARSRALRWLVVLILLGLIGVAGATVGRKYIAMVIRPSPALPETEGRVETLLDEGERALGDGDLDTAKEAFDKASALAEREPRVLIDLARLEAVRADDDWLKVRVLSADLPDALAAAKRQAQQSAQRALRAAEKAAEVAPDDPRTARAKIDALRLTADLGTARTLVPRVGGIAAHPETAYVLAALDLSEESPTWPAVLDRLKTAAAGESNLQRARGALVYALVRSGDLQLAKSELDKIAAGARPHPLLPELKAFVARASGLGAAEVDAGKRDSGATAAAVDARVPQAAPAGEGAGGGDFRSILQQATQAAAARNYDRAEQLYRVALAKNPGDTEALAGLGDVARARGNPSLAKSYYERVLAANPHYLPSLAALADVKWEGGDRAGAVKLYRDILDTTSEGTLANRARDRIAQAESPSKPATRPARPSEPTPPPSPPPAEPPEIDTSDLPGFKR